MEPAFDPPASSQIHLEHRPACRTRGAVAQLVEHRTHNPNVPGSSPGAHHQIQAFPDRVESLHDLYGCSSAGRAPVSKTDCRGFEPLHPCQVHHPTASLSDVRV